MSSKTPRDLTAAEKLRIIQSQGIWLRASEYAALVQLAKKEKRFDRGS